jgi:hypothetical protein
MSSFYPWKYDRAGEPQLNQNITEKGDPVVFPLEFSLGYVKEIMCIIFS